MHEWEAKLLYIQDFVDQTLLVQRTWMQLEPIFISDDIKRQLPTESAGFAEVDVVFRERMKQVASDTHCLAIAGVANIVEDMTAANDKLEIIQKGLKDYLETKRLCSRQNICILPLREVYCEAFRTQSLFQDSLSLRGQFSPPAAGGSSRAAGARYFPRFFFLNDADLLSILAETKDPTLVQPHMGAAAGTELAESKKLMDTRTTVLFLSSADA